MRTGCVRRAHGRERRSLYGDYREMLERERLDFVAVCPRWVGARVEMVIAAADAGVKGIYLREAVRRYAGRGGRDAGGVRADGDAGGRGAQEGEPL